MATDPEDITTAACRQGHDVVDVTGPDGSLFKVTAADEITDRG